MKVTSPGVSALWGDDIIRVDGREIPGPSQRLYLMLNKPFGYISSLKDPEGRPLVTELISDVPRRVYPVGRLDFDTMGLLLLTDDGEWAHRLTHPRYQIPRTYKVTVAGRITDRALNRLTKGVMLEEGHSGPSRTGLVTRNQSRSIVRVTITQGRTRQVRRMMEEVGFRVIHLIRISFGNLQLGDLKVGSFRYLEREEVLASKRLTGMV